jgi:stress response protein YsnF
MRKVKDAKYLFPIALSCTALLAGCYSPDRGTSSSYYQSSSYTPGSGLTSSDTSYTSSQDQDQGATGGQTYQTTGTGEIQSERMVIPLHEEQVQVGKRTVETGTIRLRKQITTETINQPVQIRKETIVVDREPSSGSSTTSQSFQSSQRQGQSQFQSQSGSISQPFEQGEIVVRLHSEEPVIEKRVVPAGNIVVETRVNNEQVNVQQQIRREKIDVDKGNAQNVIVSENLQQSSTREATGAPQPEPQRYREQPTRDTSTNTRSSETDLEYRSPVTTREHEGFPRPQPDGHETFPELKKDPERQPNE